MIRADRTEQLIYIYFNTVKPVLSGHRIKQTPLLSRQ